MLVAFDRLSLGREAGQRFGVTLRRAMQGESEFVSENLRTFIKNTGLTVLVGVIVAVLLGRGLSRHRSIGSWPKRGWSAKATWRAILIGNESSAEITLLSTELDAMVELARRAASAGRKRSPARVAVVEKCATTTGSPPSEHWQQGIAHELGTPLHIGVPVAPTASRPHRLLPMTCAEAESIRSQCERMRIIVEQLLHVCPQAERSAKHGVAARCRPSRHGGAYAGGAEKLRNGFRLCSQSADIRRIAHVGLIEQAPDQHHGQRAQAVSEDGIVRVAVREVRSDKGPR